MKTEAVINKVVITAEAEFDYESEFGLRLPKLDIKRETEEYISGSLSRFSGYYFRIKYLDEATDRMLMLFVYKGVVLGCMQLWEIRGICPAEDWTVELEEDGQIREWLNTKINPTEETDWVWDLRLKEERRQKEIAEEFGEEEESSMPEIKEMLKNYKLNQAKIAVGESQELKADMARLDKCIAELDGEANAIITLLYVQGQSLRKVGNTLGYCKSVIDRKKDRAVEILAILYAEARK